jgi:hypothetical protein
MPVAGAFTISHAKWLKRGILKGFEGLLDFFYGMLQVPFDLSPSLAFPLFHH